MPELELMSEMIIGNTQIIGAAYVQCVMLWPDDPEARARAFRACTAKVSFDCVLETLSRPEVLRVIGGESAIQKQLKDAFEAPRLSELRDEILARGQKGYVAGSVLHDCLKASAAGSSFKLESVFNEVSGYVGRALSGPLSSLSIRSVGLSHVTFANSIWPAFRPVAHLWAAFRLCPTTRSAGCPLGSAPSDFLNFLAVAEELRNLGHQCRLQRSLNTLLPSDAVWRVPDSIELPRVQVAA